MKIVQYDDWKIEVDIDKTKQYYSSYKKNDTQVNRNFAKYCENLTAEEKSFFDSFGIDPTCCDIITSGTDSKGNSLCLGYYFVYGKYLEHPQEPFESFEEFVENGFTEADIEHPVIIGMFQFDFQCEDCIFSSIPEEMPQGFICIHFRCKDMKWLLSEKPKERLYEPPKSWEIHKKVKLKITNQKRHVMNLKKAKSKFASFFEDLNIEAKLLSKRETTKHKEQWVDAFSPDGSNKKDIQQICLGTRKNPSFLWHMFSFEFLNCEIEENAKALFDQENKSSCTIVSNVDDFAFVLKNAEKLNAELLEQFIDVTVTANDFSWTYSKTHEGMCGPYFYKK